MDFYKFKKIFTNVRVIILLVLLFGSFVVIDPALFKKEGVAIRAVATNSSASFAGISGATANLLPRQREILQSINGIPVDSVETYYELIESIPANVTVTLKTNKNVYRPTTKSILNQTIVGTKDILVEQINETTNKTINVTTQVPVIDGTILGVEDIGLSVYKVPKSNLRLGLDLEGGIRVLLKPEESDTEVTEEDINVIIESLSQRLNVYGLSDIVVKSASDLTGGKYVLVEIPGANKDEVKELLSHQGNFQGKIGSNLVFTGGEDITYVCRTADCSGIDPTTGCGTLPDGQEVCSFRFGISLTPESANHFADLTRDLDVIAAEDGKESLSERLYFYLDGALVNNLSISAGLKGQAATDVTIQGSGVGLTREEAVANALSEMKKMQTVLETGSLPVKMIIVKTDNISPILGSEFIKNIFLVGALILLSVAVVVFLKYKMIKIVIPMIINMFSELVLLLGFAALVGWNLDLAAIAGVLIAIGTGIDHQIVIADEILRGEKLSGNYSWAQKLKRAFSIIMVAYFTTVAAMFFLLTAGAGLLKGFALTTIAGVTLGVFITRPAFASIIEILMKE